MKNLLRISKIFPSIVLLASCHSSHKTVVTRPAPSRTVVVVQQPQSQPQSLPPGQAKKVYGSQSAKPFAPGQQKKQVVNVYPLIIVRTSAMVVYTFSDGRRYHRNGDGMIYWLGKDDRFYLDDSYISKVKYDDKEYNEWKEKKDHGDKEKNKQEISNSREKEKGNIDNNSSSSNGHGNKEKNKQETSNSKGKEKGNIDNNSSSSNGHGNKEKNKQETSDSKGKEKGNKDNNSSSSNDHGDKGKNKQQTSNLKEKEKGNKDDNSSSSNDQKKDQGK